MCVQMSWVHQSIELYWRLQGILDVCVYVQVSQVHQSTELYWRLQGILDVCVCVQVSQVYQSIELSRLAELAPFTTPLHLEKVVVETAHSNNILVILF